MSTMTKIRQFAHELAQGRRNHPQACSRWDAVRNFRRWSRALRPGASALADGAPWIPFAARDFLEKALRPEMRVCEYGSGGSTLFFASRVRELVSVEHDALWAEKVSAVMAAHRGAAWTLNLQVPQPEPGAAGRADSDPDGYVSSGVAFTGCSLRNYATAIDAFPDGHFDVVLVDGRARPSCTKHALPKLRAGGLLILDNAERESYRTCHELPAALGWPCRDYFGPGPYVSYFWRATIWQKTGAPAPR